MTPETREAVLKRDDWRCRAISRLSSRLVAPCTRRNGLEVHHLLNRSQGGTDSPENLLTLCSYHHRRATDRKGVWYRPHPGAPLVVAWLTTADDLREHRPVFVMPKPRETPPAPPASRRSRPR